MKKLSCWITVRSRKCRDALCSLPVVLTPLCQQENLFFFSSQWRKLLTKQSQQEWEDTFSTLDRKEEVRDYILCTWRAVHARLWYVAYSYRACTDLLSISERSSLEVTRVSERRLRQRTVHSANPFKYSNHCRWIKISWNGIFTALCASRHALVTLLCFLENCKKNSNVKAVIGGVSCRMKLLSL